MLSRRGHSRRMCKYLLICCIFMGSIYFYYLYLSGVLGDIAFRSHSSKILQRENKVTVVVVLCSKSNPLAKSKYLQQLKVLIKSLLLYEYEYLKERKTLLQVEEDKLELLLFSDTNSIWDEVKQILYKSGELSSQYVNLIRVTFAPVLYPKEFEHLKNLFQPCASFRLFLGQALPNYDSVLYVDTDVIFMKNAGVVYSEVTRFNESQWIGLGPDWYHCLPGSVPFYGTQGLNSGVGIYNLTRMRSSSFMDQIPTIYSEHMDKLLNGGGDQGFLNIYFHQRPHEVRQLPCEHNFIPLHCIKSPLCDGPLSRNGVAVLHGCWNAFFKNKPASQFSITFQEYEDLKMNDSTALVDVSAFRQRLRERLEENKQMFSVDPPDAWYETGCIKNAHFLHNLFGNDE